MRELSAPDIVRRAERRLLSLRPPHALLLSFVALAVLGALLLKLPVASHHGTSWSQAFFMAVSAATVTGLAVVDVGAHFTLFGQVVLLGLIQLGGLGLMTFGVFILFIARDRVSMQQRAVIGEVLTDSGANVGGLLRAMFGFTLVIELAGTMLLAAQWVPEMGFAKGLYYSAFHAVSAFNNAGLGLRPDNLIAHATSPLVNAVISALFITGGIGFVVISEVLTRRRFRDYSLHTKVMLVATLAINVLAMLAILVLEYGNPKTIGGLPDLGSKLWAAWFQGVAPRSAGFNTVDVAAMGQASALLTMALMFIGGGSGSTASGIKLTTFVVLLAATSAYVRGRERPVLFGRSLPSAIVLKAMSITIISMCFVGVGVFALTITERQSFLDLAYEVVSALGTVGLSRGITAQLSVAGQVILMVVMLLGRVGPLTLAFMLSTRGRAPIEYPSGQLNVG